MPKKTFYRWVPREHCDKAVKQRMLSHNGSALWVFGMGPGETYRPGHRIVSGSVLIAYDMDSLAAEKTLNPDHFITAWDDGEDGEADAKWAGESAHPMKVIVKNNEPGAYGLGRHRQGATRVHTKARFATKAEVGKVLGFNSIELGDRRNTDKYKPPRGWPT